MPTHNNTNTIPDFAKSKIQTLRQRSDPIFGRLLMAIRNAKESDFTIYKPDHAIKLKSDILQKPRKELHALIKEFLTDSKVGKQRISDKIFSYTEPTIDPDPSTQIVSSLRAQEIRSLLRNMDLNERKTLVENELKAGSSEILIAISSSPDELIPDKTLTKYRNQLAYAKDSTLQDYKQQVDELEKIVRKECGKLNADHTEILLENKLDDPISLEDHFNTFPPKDDHQKNLANGMINRERNHLELKKNNENFDANNSGISL